MVLWNIKNLNHNREKVYSILLNWSKNCSHHLTNQYGVNIWLGEGLVCFYDFPIGFWNCFDCVECLVLTVWNVLFWLCGMSCFDCVECLVLTVWNVLFWLCGMSCFDCAECLVLTVRYVMFWLCGCPVLIVWYVLFWLCGMSCFDCVVCLVLAVWYVLFWLCGLFCFNMYPNLTHVMVTLTVLITLTK
jgi:hypothetical protein